MPRRTGQRDPSYRLHKQSGQAVVTIPDGIGGRRDILLGKYDSPESRAEYHRVVGEWRAAGCRLPAPTLDTGVSVAEVAAAYVRHAEATFGPAKPGETSSTTENIKIAVRPLRELYGYTAAADLGPRALKALQKHLVDQGLSRNTINRRIGRIKTIFRWAESEEMIPASTYHALRTVRGLERGRSAAKETAPVRPVSAEVVQATVTKLMPMLADMVRLQQLTGMRPGELVRMRGIDLDTSGTVWQYRPGSDVGQHGDHKTAHHGYARPPSAGVARGTHLL
jgi:integrase